MIISLRRGDPARVGPYRLDGRLGEGGMGTVFLGTSPGGRQVAVKVIKARHAADPRFRARFAREVEAARKVGGFHTAQVVDADADAESPWMATAYVPGPSLRNRVLRDGPLAPDAVRALGAALAEGLAAIHRHGLVHRDLKPGNVILSPDGPRIIDFGVARAADADPLTADGAVVGTYAYMAPEQIRGEPSGPAADLFALGCVLVYAATGNGPFDASTVPAIVHRVLTETPRLTGIPADLARAAGACLNKDPGARPSTAALIAHLAGPESARLPDVPVPPTTPPPGTWPAAEEPTLPPGTVVATKEEGTPAPPGAGTARRMPRRAVLAGALATGAVALAGGGGALYARRRGGRTAGTGPEPASTLPISPAATLTGHAHAVDAVAFSPDGRLLASGSAGDETARLWDVATGRTVRELTGAGVRSAAFSPDGRYLATGNEDDTASLWDVATGRRIRSSRAGEHGVWSVAFSPDGRTLAGGGSGVRLWDVATGATTTLDTGPLTRNRVGDRVPNLVLGLAYGPDGRTVAAALDGYGEEGGDGAILIWDVATRRRVAVLRGRTEENLALAAGPDGATLVTCGGSEDVHVWDVAARRETDRLSGHLGEVRAVAFAGNGTLASCGEDRTVRLWDLAGRRATAVLTGHTELLTTVAISRDGRTVAAGGGQDDKTVRLWRVRG
ncbi:WD40 repeat domain-containing serine/threonine protein kinase [Actinomadura sp. 21ATH]|uniref:WD40 repeat domain-containing serine/threonine protein kinase n=1 Tax=Actinomadura sp. 21ATH TaxID=1735444 RepID=UPI0035C0FA2C